MYPTSSLVLLQSARPKMSVLLAIYLLIVVGADYPLLGTGSEGRSRNDLRKIETCPIPLSFTSRVTLNDSILLQHQQCDNERRGNCDCLFSVASDLRRSYSARLLGIVGNNAQRLHTHTNGWSWGEEEDEKLRLQCKLRIRIFVEPPDDEVELLLNQTRQPQRLCTMSPLPRKVGDSRLEAHFTSSLWYEFDKLQLALFLQQEPILHKRKRRRRRYTRYMHFVYIFNTSVASDCFIRIEHYKLAGGNNDISDSSHCEHVQIGCDILPCAKENLLKWMMWEERFDQNQSSSSSSPSTIGSIHPKSTPQRGVGIWILRILFSLSLPLLILSLRQKMLKRGRAPELDNGNSSQQASDTIVHLNPATNSTQVLLLQDAYASLAAAAAAEAAEVDADEEDGNGGAFVGLEKNHEHPPPSYENVMEGGHVEGEQEQPPPPYEQVITKSFPCDKAVGVGVSMV